MQKTHISTLAHWHISKLINWHIGTLSYRHISIILFLLISFSLQSQLLWKISGKNLEQPSYLFGTHHLIPISFLDSVPGLLVAFNDCDVVIGEMDMNTIDATARIIQAAMLPQGLTMDSLLNPDDYMLVDAELKSVMRFGLKEIGLMNPTIIKTMYELELYKKVIGIPEDVQSDTYFQLLAIEKNKKVIGLEDIDKQVEILFGNKDLNREATLLVETIRKKDEVINDIFKLNNLYKAGKIEELIEMAKSQDDKLAMTDEEYAEMVDNRNFDWINVLPGYMEKSPAFIAVGAMHLGGENGLIHQLRKLGYKVTEVSAEKKKSKK